MNTTKLFYFGAGIAVCAGCLARLLTLNAEESFIVFCIGVAGLLLAFGTVVVDALSYRKRRFTTQGYDQLMQDEELKTQGSWGVDSNLSDTAKEV